MNAFEELMTRRWIIKDQDKDLYYKLKDQVADLKKFFSEKLGYQIIVNPYLIKLEKMPASPEPWMGIQEFTEKIHYIFLSLILMFLEDKETAEQFILSELTEYIQARYEEESIDWTSFQYRRHLVRVIKFCLRSGLVKINDGTQEQFVADYENEVLYENMGTSRYFMRNFTQDIQGFTKPEDFYASDWIDVDEARGVIRRQRVYRRLLMTLGVYKAGEDDEDFAYIKNYRKMVGEELQEFIDCELQVHRTSAYLILGENCRMGKTFPAEKTISDIVLLCNGIIHEHIQKGDFIPQADEKIRISRNDLRSLVEECRARYGEGWIKSFRDKTTSEVYQEVKQCMESYGMIETLNHGEVFILNPVIGKITGHYPADYKGEK